METKPEDKQIIPDIIIDEINKTTYKKGRFFGKGGFAKCYEITEGKTGHAFAGKIVSKLLVSKSNQKEKMTQEIAIHRSLKHANVVGFHSFFEDSYNVYIVLELCQRRSMMELHKRRKALTEPEARFYLHQILLGVHYLHSNKIIHRDLKLGNIFLDNNLQIKIGDFGLAAKIEYDGERKKTLCGTPNYIAPEILSKKGHSYEVDVWSIGCILYTLLVGKPPFETSSLKETYSRIKRCEYKLPFNMRISKQAGNLIKEMLQSEPKLRPSIQKCLDSDFFTCGYMPSQLPVSCLTMPPRFDATQGSGFKDSPVAANRKPLLEVNQRGAQVGIPSPNRGPVSRQSTAIGSGRLTVEVPASDCRKHMITLREQLGHMLKHLPPIQKDKQYGDDMTDPAAQPLVWISKWVDYSDKYGFGYQLSDEGVGVMFNDSTKIILLADAKNVHYIARDGMESYYTMEDFPARIDKKIKLLSYFQRYMNEHLVKAGGGHTARECDSLSRMPYLFQWFRTTSGVIMQLTNGTLQINFTDHSKIVLCPLMAAVTFIGADQSFQTFRFSSIEEFGASQKMQTSLRYAYDKVSSLIGC